MALESQGVICFFSTTTSGSTAAAAIVGGVSGFNGPSGAANVIDITSLQSTAKEKLMGLRDEGKITVDVYFSATDVAQTKMRECRANRTKCNLGLGLTDGSSSLIGQQGYVTNFSITGSVDNAIKAAITFEIDGPSTWSTFTK